MFFQLGWWHVHRGPLLIWNQWPGKNISRHMVQLSCLSVGHCDSTLWPNHLCRFGAAGLAIGLGAGWHPFWVCALEALSSPPLLKEPLWQEAVCSLPGARRPGSSHHISTGLNQNRSAVLQQSMVDWICTFQVRGIGIALCIQKQWSERLVAWSGPGPWNGFNMNGCASHLLRECDFHLTTLASQEQVRTKLFWTSRTKMSPM